jgi:protein-tyrosine phosphatase
MLAPAVPLTGALNFRDIGGHRTVNNRTVRAGVLFRSGQLARLTAEDYVLLASLGVQAVFDLRTDSERAAAPTRWHGTAPRIVEKEVGFDRAEDPTEIIADLLAAESDGGGIHAVMRTIVARIAIRGAAGIGDVLRTLAAGEMPAIIHCTAGKDRTGLSVAVLLTLLGVPEEAVRADYLRSNVELDRAPAAPVLPTAAHPLPAEVVSAMLRVDRSYLDAAFAAMRARYGTFEGYVAEGLRLTAHETEALRARLLE